MDTGLMGLYSISAQSKITLDKSEELSNEVKKRQIFTKKNCGVDMRPTGLAQFVK